MDKVSETQNIASESLKLEELTVDRASVIFSADSRIIIPVGSIAQYHPSLPLGTSAIIVERLAEEMSAEFQVIRVPTIHYGVNAENTATYPGRVSVRKKTLQQFLNDTLAGWEKSGITEFIFLTIHAYDPHLEVIESVAATEAKVRAVNLLAVDLTECVDMGVSEDLLDSESVLRCLMLYLAPELVEDNGIVTPGSQKAVSAEAGKLFYDTIKAKVRDRIFLAPGY